MQNDLRLVALPAGRARVATPNQPHQIVPTGWGDGWMGMGATPGAEFNTRCQLIRSVPYLIQGVRGKLPKGRGPQGVRFWPP